jgi:hypothetical protein
MNDAQVLELLVDRYAAVPAPAPSRALAARMDAGWTGTADDDRGAVVVPVVRRPRLRLRYLVAALVAGFVAMSGLAAAGALPDPVQRGVASVASHLGIDLPHPNGGAGSGPADGGTGGNGPSGGTPNGSTPGASGAGSGSHAGSSGSGSSGSSSGAGIPNPATTTTLPGVGGVGVPTTTLPPVTPPPGAAPPVSLPPLTVPPISLPPVTPPPISLPGVTVPPISLPPVSLPPISLPPLLPGL